MSRRMARTGQRTSLQLTFSGQLASAASDGHGLGLLADCRSSVEGTSSRDFHRSLPATDTAKYSFGQPVPLFMLR